MNSLFFSMLAGHLVADFWLQPASWVNHKMENGWKSKKLILHTLIAAILPVAFTLELKLWWFVPVVFLTHYLIDVAKSRVRQNIWVFLADQLLHIGILWILARFFTDIIIPENLLHFWIYACGFILITNPLGILTGMFLKSVTKSESNPVQLNASAWIGIFERILIIIFVITGQIQAIGFLVAAKSVFRFGEVQKDGNQKAEYFLLGTLVSFTMAIVVGFGMKLLII
jgi:nitrate reductase gamma subunit